MGRKAKIRANKKKQRSSNKSLNYIKSIGKQKSSSLLDATNQHLCDIGIAFKGKDGKIRATKALVEGYIPGWQYDFENKIAHRIESEQNLKLILDFDDISKREQIPEKYLTIKNLQCEAKVYLEEKNMSMFKQTLAKIKQLQPYIIEADVYVNQGCRYLDRGHFDEAIKRFNLANWINPYHALAYYNRGNYYSLMNNYEKTIENFSISLEINPGDSDVYVSRGCIYLKYGEVEEAIQDFNRAITVNPNHCDGYLNLGVTFSQIGNYQSAIQNLNKAIELNSNDADAYYNRAFAYRELEYYQEALNDYEKSAHFYKQYGRASDFQDSLNGINKIKQIQQSILEKKTDKIIIFEDEIVKNSDNRIIVEVIVQYIEDNNELIEQYYDVVLRKDGNSYDNRIRKLIKQASSKPLGTMQWTEP